MASKTSEWKSYFKFPLLQEKQRSVRVSDMQHQMGELKEELRRTKEERCRALDELAELKRMNGDPYDRIRLTELQSMQAKDSEKKMFESLVSQAKLLEQAKISFDEAKLEIKGLKESIRKMERSASVSVRNASKKVVAFDPVRAQDEVKRLRKELRLAQEAEDNSKKAMVDFSLVLEEVSSDANQAKAELTVRQFELEKAMEEAYGIKSSLQCAEKELTDTLNGHDKLKLELEESISGSKAKEDSFLGCVKISDEEISKWRQENSRLNDAWNVAREDNAKQRQTMTQAVNDAMALKEALELVRSENSQMKDQLVEKEQTLQQLKQDYESLKVSEAAALDSVRELNSLLPSTSVADSKKNSNLSEIGSFRLSQSTTYYAKARRSMTKFSSERWKPGKNFIWNGRRHSVGEQGMLNRSTFDREKSIESSSIMFSSLRNVPENRVPSAFPGDEIEPTDTDTFDHLEGILSNDMGSTNHRKNKTVLERLGNALRRKSFHK